MIDVHCIHIHNSVKQNSVYFKLVLTVPLVTLKGQAQECNRVYADSGREIPLNYY